MKLYLLLLLTSMAAAAVVAFFFGRTYGVALYHDACYNVGGYTVVGDEVVHCYKFIQMEGL